MILQRRSKEALKPWEMPVLFPSTLDIEHADSIVLEIGPGRGDFLYHLADVNRDGLVAAIEIKRKRIDRLMQRLQMRGIDNVILIQSDARWALPRFFNDSSVNEIHINFPDPWPKKRHTKNRLMTEEFLRMCLKKLRVGGSLNFATDQGWYAKEVRQIICGIEELKSQFEEGIVKDFEGAFPTLFMQKWKEIGRILHYQRYLKVI
jgi:tRNA (guanine-N7-)-methyltransferase